MESTMSADGPPSVASAGRNRRWTRRVFVLIAVFVLLVQVFPQSYAALDDIGVAVLNVLAAIAFIGAVRIRSEKHTHAAWVLLACGQICFALWHVSRFWPIGSRNSAFGVEDASYLAYFLLVCGGLVLQPMRTLPRIVRTRMKLDVALIVAASSLVYGILILNGMRLSVSFETSPLLFRSMLDILLIWVLAVMLLRQASPSPAQLAYGFGILLLAAADVIAMTMYVGALVDLHIGELDMLFSSLSAVAVLSAALLHMHGVRWPEKDYRLPSAWRRAMRRLTPFFVEFLLPYGWSFGAISVYLLIYGYSGTPLRDGELVLTGVGITIIFLISVARRWLTLEENAALMHRQTRLQHAAYVLAQPLDLRSAPLRILEQAGSLTPNDEAILFLVRDGGCLAVTVGRSWDEARASGIVSLESTDEPLLFAQEKIGVLTEVYEHAIEPARAAVMHRLLTKARRMLWQEVEPPDFQEWIVAPMCAAEEKIGVLVLGSRTGDWDVQEHRAVLESYVRQAAATIVNARLRQKQTDMAAMAERSRLSRELHDSVLQAIFGCSLGLRTAQHYVDATNSSAHDALSYSLRLAEGAISEMRALIFELRPETLANEGLLAALQKQAQSLCDRHSIHAAVRSASGEPALAEPVKETFYRIAIEALQNVIKHARARAVQIDLHESAERVCMVINDDGVGFDPHGDFRGHLGLVTMHERAAQIGAALVLTSAPGSGTRVELCIRGAAAS